MDSKDLIRSSKHLSFLLRHQKDEPKVDEHGYALVSDILKALNIKRKDLDEIVEMNDKKRFEYSEDKNKIRARQGHTIQVDVDLMEMIPPDLLYHGTCTLNLEDIYKEGIKKMKRQHVHLTEDLEIAKNNGKRYGVPCAIAIDSQKMHEDGIKFYLSNNDVWLTDFVDSKYIMDIVFF